LSVDVPDHVILLEITPVGRSGITPAGRPGT